jgi:hypothetical protein
MADHLPRRDPSTPTEWLIGGILVLAFAAAMIAEIADQFTPVKLSAALIILFWVPLLALHEGGHAVAAWLAGWRVRQVVIGMGKTLARFRMGDADVEIRLLPIEGFVSAVPKRLSLPRLENALIYLAGPGVELLLAAGILLVLGPDRLFTLTDDYRLIVWQSLAAAATVQAALNLIPIAIQTPEGDTASDGLGILLSLVRPRDYYEAMLREVEPSSTAPSP